MLTRSVARRAPLTKTSPERWSARASVAVIIVLSVGMWVGIIALTGYLL